MSYQYVSTTTGNPVHPTMRDPFTGFPVQAIGVVNGRPVWPVMGGSQPAGEPAPAATPAPSIPATVPAPASPPPAPAPNAPAPTAPAQPAGPEGFPPNTPWRDMSTEQQLAYWQHQARRHEERVKGMHDYDHLKNTAAEYQRLVEASQTEQQRAVAEAHRQGRAEALGEAGGRLVEAHMRAAAVGRLPEERVSTLLEGLDRTKFLTSTGEVDTARVSAYVTAIAPPVPVLMPASAIEPTTVTAAAPTTSVTWNPAVQPPAAPAALAAATPDFGQGAFTPAPPSRLEAGRAAARARFPKPTTPQSS